MGKEKGRSLLLSPGECCAPLLSSLRKTPLLKGKLGSRPNSRSESSQLLTIQYMHEKDAMSRVRNFFSYLFLEKYHLLRRHGVVLGGPFLSGCVGYKTNGSQAAETEADPHSGLRDNLRRVYR